MDHRQRVELLKAKVGGPRGLGRGFGNPDAIHFATAALPGAKDAMGVRLQAEYKLEWLGVLVVADMLYGVIENREAAGVEIISVD